MALYFLHLRDGTSELLDPEGQEFATLPALRTAVLATVRDLMMGDIRKGVLNLRLRLDAQDKTGKIVHTLPFGRAVTIFRVGGLAHLARPI